ncbi:MAPEG family protein [Kordiimonas lipolytica]|uniref:MAPEG family protein n=1 Tax=Kordiimonas lipolytica TaxID=1662421 RepID=A0ABV8U999_9PROT|nr:MAPEG family protein [Kordiimonas lipolytica]
MDNALLGPVLAQVALTFVAWLILYWRRLPAMAAAKPTKEQMQDKANLAKLPPKARYAAENYNHLFEMPVLFYVLCLGAMITGLGDGLTAKLAWAYVALRLVHTLIHSSYNNVMHRFTAFTLSGLVLLVMFGQIALKYWSI